MKAVVIGSEGNIGKKLVPYLRSIGYTVLRVDVLQGIADDYAQADINVLSDLYGPAQKFAPDVVFHLSAMVSRVTCEVAASLAISTNISGTNNVCQLCKFLGAKMVNFSTSEIYGNITGIMHEDRVDKNPNNRYGMSKLLAEKIVEYEVENHGLKAVTVRPFMFYCEDETMGDHRSAMIRFAEALLTGKQIVLHEGSKRSWMHIDDAVVALEKASHLEEYCALNIGHPHYVTMEYVARKMCEMLGLEFDDCVRIEDLPARMTLEKKISVGQQLHRLGFEPKISIDDGIGRVVDRAKERLSQK